MPTTTTGSDPFLTRWTIITQARAGSEEAINWLFTKYRPVLIPWVQTRFQKNFHDAEELVQGFSALLLFPAALLRPDSLEDVGRGELLGNLGAGGRKDFLRNVDKSKGRFRTFLFASLRNYIVSEFRKKKLPLPDSLDQIVEEGGALPSAPPEEAGIIWVRELLKIAWRRLQEEAASQGRRALCAALEPVLFADQDKPSYAQIAQQLGMTEGAVKTAACRLRERFGCIIREEVRETVATEPDLKEELGYLLSLLQKTDPGA